MSHLIQLDPVCEENIIITIYIGDSKEEAEKVENYLIDAYCSGTPIEFEWTPDKVLVKDVLKVFDNPLYRVLLKGELTDEQ